MRVTFWLRASILWLLKLLRGVLGPTSESSSPFSNSPRLKGRAGFLPPAGSQCEQVEAKANYALRRCFNTPAAPGPPGCEPLFCQQLVFFLSFFFSVAAVAAANARLSQWEQKTQSGAVCPRLGLGLVCPVRRYAGHDSGVRLFFVS